MLRSIGRQSVLQIILHPGSSGCGGSNKFLFHTNYTPHPCRQLELIVAGKNDGQPRGSTTWSLPGACRTPHLLCSNQPYPGRHHLSQHQPHLSPEGQTAAPTRPSLLVFSVAHNTPMQGSYHATLVQVVWSGGYFAHLAFVPRLMRALTPGTWHPGLASPGDQVWPTVKGRDESFNMPMIHGDGRGLVT
ncbi:hypothetical protein Hamer_G019604 [Homarus americanus]|uniref:Uncharacterized protein n=1 Tax=Homarus americanus TaxID=6706 RepID=A0A8J5MYW0_HOMAM|nr:hypothetical protein Hamer_G019604 [Homarus americanus]